MEKIELKNFYPFLKRGSLKPLVINEVFDDPQKEWRRPAVIVVPGGGYFMVSNREGETVASRFLALGFQTFILTYSVAPQGGHYPDQIEELGAAIDYVKKNADRYHVNPEEVFAMGFSAGGHLVADLAMEAPRLEKEKGLDCSLKAIGLGYPVISNHGIGEANSYKNIVNGYSEEEQARLKERLSLEDKVSKINPPAYIFATGEDQTVPVQNSVLYASALWKLGVPCELHIFAKGVHGISTGDKEVTDCPWFTGASEGITDWPKECALFWRNFVKEKF